MVPPNSSRVHPWAVLLMLAMSVSLPQLLPAQQPAEEKPAADEPAAEGGRARTADYIRVVRGDDKTPQKLETAIVSFKPASGEGELVVDLVAAVHVGDRSYYDALNKQFEKYDVVLYELVAPEGTRIPKGGRDAADSPIAMFHRLTQNVLELESQTDRIDYTKENFVHADMSPEAMAKAMAERGDDGLTLALSVAADWLRAANLQRAKAEAAAAEDQKEPALKEDPFALLADPARGVKLKRMMAEQFAGQGLEGSLGPTLERMLVHDRNDAAMKVFQKELAKGRKKIAIFYGAAHMPDFQRRLQADFALKRSETTWLTAWDMKPSNMKPSSDPLQSLLRKLLEEAAK